MDFQVETKKARYKMRATMQTARLYRSIFLSDLIKDLTLDSEELDAEKITKIMYVHVLCRDESIQEYEAWTATLPAIPLSDVITAIQTVWTAITMPTVDIPADTGESEGRVRDTDLGYSNILYIGKKLKLSLFEMDVLTPGEILDMLYTEVKMQEEQKNPVYLATQDDYENFF